MTLSHFLTAWYKDIKMWSVVETALDILTGRFTGWRRRSDKPSLKGGPLQSIFYSIFQKGHPPYSAIPAILLKEYPRFFNVAISSGR